MNSRHYLAMLPLMAANAYAELTPMDDESLEATVGQAYIEMESFANGSTQYNRITFGQTIEIQTNADEVVFGEGYLHDTPNQVGTAADVDLNLQNVSLGYIDNATGNIIPFTLTNPYLELAKDASNNITGFRIGFGEAQGKFQADFNSFSGNIGMQIDGTDAILFNSGNTITNSRATKIGLGDCSSSCWDLNNVNGLDVGEGAGATGDFFMSFQKDNGVQWRLADGATYTTNVTEGFFLNVPTTNNFTSAEMSAGTQAFSTEFIDRGVGRFTGP